MVGTDGEVPVQCDRVDETHFRCTYTPLKAGEEISRLSHSHYNYYIVIAK